MKNLVYLFIIALVSSCSSITSASVDFHPSLKFSYLHNGKMIAAEGSAGANFKMGDRLVVTVPNQGVWDRCKVGALNGDAYATASCRGSKSKYRTLDLGILISRTPIVIAINVVKGDEKQFGYLYIDTGIPRGDLNLRYNCMLWSHNGRAYTCVRQRGFDFMVDIHIPQFQGPGKMQIVSMKCNGGEDRRLSDVVAGEIVQVNLRSLKEEYCAYRIDVKSTQGLALGYSALLHINFFKDFFPNDY